MKKQGLNLAINMSVISRLRGGGGMRGSGIKDSEMLCIDLLIVEDDGQERWM